MDSNLLPHVQVRFNGITWHRWRAGHVVDIPRVAEARTQSTDCTLWLNLQAGVRICALQPDGMPGREWELPASSVFIWPMSLPRRIMTPIGGEWLSLGLRASLFDRINLFQSLQLPREIEVNKEQWQFLRESTGFLLNLCHGENPPAVDYDSMSFYASRLQLNYAAQSPISRWLSQSIAQTIFGICWQVCQSTDLWQQAPGDLPSWLLTSLTQLEREPSLKVSEMARDAGFSTAQFRRLFQHWLGMPPQQYVHQHRMESARQLLEASDLPVGDISLRMGFASLSHFSRIFKSTYGLTPVRYRQSFLRSLT